MKTEDYFKNVKKNDKVYGLVFGKGKVIEVFKEGFYRLLVHFDNGYELPYTVEGVCNWGSFYDQTLFYKNDIDLTDIDFEPVDKVLGFKKIIKLRNKNKLCVRTPSGAWINYNKCDTGYCQVALEKGQFHLFRKCKSKKEGIEGDK